MCACRIELGDKGNAALIEVWLSACGIVGAFGGGKHLAVGDAGNVGLAFAVGGDAAGIGSHVIGILCRAEIGEIGKKRSTAGADGIELGHVSLDAVIGHGFLRFALVDAA